jgi:acyl transferase domain-containing protein
VVLSGDVDAVDALTAVLDRDEIFHREVRTSYAFHSHQMAPFQEALARVLGDLRPGAGICQIYSTVTGAAIEGTALDAAYWARNIREPVRFADAVQAAVGDGCRVFLEIGPHPVLSHNIRQCLAVAGVDGEQGGLALASLRRDQDDRETMARAAAGLYTSGYSLAWAQLAPAGRRDVQLPSYPWQHERYWRETKTVRSALRRSGATSHPLLGASLPVAALPDMRLWEQVFDLDTLAYLAEHRVQDQIVVPGAGFIEMALTAARATHGDQPVVIEEVAFERMLTLSAEMQRTVQSALRPAPESAAGDTASFEIFSAIVEETGAPGRWLRHVTGRVRAVNEPAPAPETLETLRSRCTRMRSSAEHYAQMSSRGLDYGPRFRGVDAVWLGEDEILGRVQLPVELEDTPGYGLHPALLDACVQVLMAQFFERQTAGNAGHLVPVGVAQVRVHRRPGRALWAHARPARKVGTGAALHDEIGDLVLLDEQGVVAELRGLRARALALSPGMRPTGDDWLHTIAWRRRDLPSDMRTTTMAVAWLALINANDPVSTGLVARGRARGERWVRVMRGPAYQRIETDLYVVDPARVDDFVAVLRDALGEGTPCRGVVHLWSRDGTPASRTTLDSLQADQGLGSVSALHLTQALMRHGRGTRGRCARGCHGHAASRRADEDGHGSQGAGRVEPARADRGPATRFLRAL